MTQHADILLDFNNMMAEGVGTSGLERQEIQDLEKILKEIHQGIMDLERLGQLPFLELPRQDDAVRDITRRCDQLKTQFDTMLLIGIGGSALGPRFLVSALGEGRKSSVVVCDSLDGDHWSEIAERLNPKKTVLVVISKSGKTLETWAAFCFFYDWIKKSSPLVDQQVQIITDPEEGPLRKMAQGKKWEGFAIPPGVGGRYSIFTPVGLVPAAFAGIDLSELLAGAKRMAERCKNGDPWFNPALMSALIHYLHDQKKKRSLRVIMTYGEALHSYALWFAQLWAESLGKRFSLKAEESHSGTTPIVARGPQDQHSQLQLYLEGPDDKAITFLAVEEARQEVALKSIPGGDTETLEKRSVHELLTIERIATEEALRQRGRPNQSILLKRRDAYSLGQLILMAELETVYAGSLYNVNPFDQPAVELIKNNIRDYLSGKIPPSKNRNYTI